MAEGIFLLLFQRLNWRRWGPTIHVSKQIIWISPVVDLAFFVLIALLVFCLSSVWRRLPCLRILLFILLFLSVYDWTLLTDRLYPPACLVLALGVAVAGTRWVKRNELPLLRFWKKTLPYLCVLWLAIFGGMKLTRSWIERRAIATLPPAAATSPNILLIVIDTLRADHLSSYGYSRLTTPNLDRIAGQGVLFQNAISACSWTLPSHASLLTGRYPFDHGMQNAQPMPWLGWGHSALRGYPTLGEGLEHLGYRTGAFSANQTYFTSNVGLGRGFIHFEDYFQSPQDMFLRTFWGREFDRAYLHRSNKSAWTRGLRAIGLGSLLDGRKRASEVNRETLAWIDRSHRPFFVFLNYIEVHDAAWLTWKQPPRWGIANPIDQYDSALTQLDGEIENLFRELDHRGLLSNTVVIVTGDHGESLGQHYMQYHGIALYREQIDVPLILWNPNRISSGVQISEPVSNAEIAATIMDLAGAKGTPVFPGRSLSALWTDKRSGTWPYPLSDLAKNEIVIDPDRQARKLVPTAMDGNMESLVTSQWHLILHQTLGAQLYDWAHDPGELTNLIATPEGRAAAEKLRSELPPEANKMVSRTALTAH